MSDAALEGRVVDLESRQAFQDDTIASLNDVLVAQQRRIDQLEKMLNLVVERLRESTPDVRLPDQEPPPPHY